FFYVTTRPPPRSPLFPYTTLFRSLSVHTSSYQAAGRLGMRVATAELAMRHARKIPRRLLVEGLRALYDADSALKAGSTNDRAVMEFVVAQLTASDTTPAMEQERRGQRE